MEAKNDEKGLAACYVRQKEALKHYIASRIDRPDEAEDVVQDVFERLWKHKDFISPEAVVSLAYKVARNLMVDANEDTARKMTCMANCFTRKSPCKTRRRKKSLSRN